MLFWQISPGACRSCRTSTPINAQGSRYGKSSIRSEDHIHPKNVFMDLPRSPQDLSYLEPCELMGVEIRQILRASGEIHQNKTL